MKIGIIIAAFSPSTIYGGPVSVALGHAKGLMTLGHEVTVLTSDLLTLVPEAHHVDSTGQVDGVPVKYFKSRWIRPRLPLVRTPGLINWLRSNHENFDVFHIHFAREWIAVRTAQLLAKHKRPLFLQPHGMLNRRDGLRSAIDLLVTRRIMKSATRVFALQSHERSILSSLCAESVIATLPNGISGSHVRGGSRRTARKRPRSLPTVLFLARLHPRKRVLTFIEMAAQLRDSAVEARYRIVGPDGGDLPRARELAAAKGLVDSIEFVGTVPADQTDAEYFSADVYVLPSVDEPFPMTVLEALQAGLPTVVTDSCHIASTLQETNSAIVSAPDAKALAVAVKGLLVGENDLYARVSESAIQTAATIFSHENVISMLEREYERTITPTH